MKHPYITDKFLVTGLLANIVAMFACFSSFALTVTIGAGATSNTATGIINPRPFGNYYEGHREQFIIKATELTTAGVGTERVITEIGFNVAALNTCCGANGLTNFTIKIKNTASAVTTTTFETGLTTVYGPNNYVPTTGWNMFYLDISFVWDGSSNLLIETCFNDEGTEGFSQNASTYYSAAGFTSTTYRSVDNDGDMCGDVTLGTTDNERVNTRIVIYNDANMTYSSSTTTQTNTSTVTQGSTANQILGVEIVTDAVNNPLSVTSFSFNTTGSTNASNDISLAQLYYTGTSGTFATNLNNQSTQVGSVAYSPSGAFAITLTQVLKPGTNYFWMTYDIKSAATVTNVVDAQCTSLNVGGAQTPSVTNPAGTRAIVAYSPVAYGAATGAATTKQSYLTKVAFNSINSNTGNDCSGTSYYCDYTSTSTSVFVNQSYEISLSAWSDFAAAGLRYVTAAAYIDWNRDGDFADGGETVLTGISGATGAAAWNTYNISATITPPAGTVLGSTRLRVGARGSTATLPPSTGAISPGEYEDYTVVIDTLPRMVYVSTTTIQNTDTVDAGAANQQVVCLRIETSGSINPLTVSQFVFRTTGTTSVADITNAQLYSTGTSSTFATTTQVGGTIAVPPASPTNMTFTPASTYYLESGYNYFWLTYDVSSSAPQGNVIDGECFSVTVNSIVRTPSPADPSGNRYIRRVNMSYSSSAVTQDNVSYVAKGDLNQVIIGIEIITAGSLNPIDATSFTLNTTGTSAPATDIQNARLWYTGSSSVFATGTQFGATVAAPSGSYVVAGTQTLFTGTNYFWLTYDIKVTALCNPNKVDAQCTSVTVGGTPYAPSPTTLLGDRVIDCNTAYYSQGNLVANTLSSWNSQRDGSGTAPTTFAPGSSPYNSFYIQNGHSMTTTANVTIPYIIIESGGYITATNLVTITDLRINTNGTWDQKFKATNGSYITNFYIYNGGTWIHNNNGSLPSGNRYFSVLSNQWFYQWGGGTFPASTTWGNVLLNGTTGGNFELGNVFNTIQGDLEWRRIGTNNYLFDARDETLNIGGDLIISGGWWKMNAGYNTALTNCNTVRTLTINVTGDLIVSAGTLEDNYCGPSGTKAILNVGGNVTISGGTVDLSTATGQLSELNLTGGTASVTWSQTGGTVTLGRTNIKTGKTVTMTGTKMGDVATGLPIIVETGATLNCSNYPVTGTGNFTLASGGTIGIGSTAGIVSSGASGNVQVTGTRSYNSGATYRYYEGLTPQSTGDYTLTIANTLANLIIDKASAANIVNLTNSTNITGTLTLTNGILTTSYTAGAAPFVRVANGASVSPAGGSANSYVDGYMRKTGYTAGTAFVFPLGNDGWWRRISVNVETTNTTDEYEARYIKAAAPDNTTIKSTSPDFLTDVSMFEYWMLTRTAGTPNAIVSLYWEAAASEGINDCSTAPPTGDLSVVRWDGSIWVNENYTGSTGGAISGSCGTNGNVSSRSYISSFSPFAFGSKSAGVNPLPIELLTFDASHNGNFVDLTWTIVTETNNDYFTVERSKDGENFEFVVNVKGAGNSNEKRNYKTQDINPYYGVSYYRLKQTDFDGKFTYSNIVAVNIARTFNFSVKPNPVQNNIYVSFTNSEETEMVITIYNSIGQLIFGKQIFATKGNNEIAIELSAFQQGLYLIRISSEWDSYYEKVLKE